MKISHWKKISIDDDRKIPIAEHYYQFQDTLKLIKNDYVIPEFFPRDNNPNPIPSYGIIAVYESEDCLEYYLTQQRTTIEFSEFVKMGPRKDRLYEYLCSMTHDERELLKNESFSKIWDDLMLHEGRLFPVVRENAIQRFKNYKKIMPDLLKYSISYTNEPPWIFPKGRQKKGDRTGLSAALRELKEEGKLEFDKIILMHEQPFLDVFRGTNNQLYSTTYYILKVEQKSEFMPLYLENNCISEQCISIDMKDYMWFKISKKQNLSKFSTPLCDHIERLLLSVHKKLTT